MKYVPRDVMIIVVRLLAESINETAWITLAMEPPP
jgi:hypothetical protein